LTEITPPVRAELTAQAGESMLELAWPGKKYGNFNEREKERDNDNAIAARGFHTHGWEW